MTLDYQAKEMTFVPTDYVPSDVLQTLTAALQSTDKQEVRILAPKSLWGFEVDKASGEEEPGVTLKKVLPASAAAKAGLKEGDRLLTLDDRWTDSVADCYAATSYVSAGTTVKVIIKPPARKSNSR